MTDLVHVALVGGALLLIFRLALGGSFWKRDRRFNWWMPSRDRDYTRGGFLAILALWGLAEVVGGASTVGPEAGSSVYALAILLALCYPANPALVGAGAGIIGTVALVLQRWTNDYPAPDNARFWIGGVITLVVLLSLRVVLSPVRAMAGPVGLAGLLTPGRSRPAASVVFAAFGVLSLLNLATRPGMFVLPERWSGVSIGTAVALVGALAVLAVGLTILPAFTISVLSLGCFVMTIYFDAVLDPGQVTDYEWQVRLSVAAAFLGVAWIVGTVMRRA